MSQPPADRYPEKQPPEGWVIRLVETGGTVTGEDFADFVTKINDQLSSNGFPVLSWQAILERVKEGK